MQRPRYLCAQTLVLTSVCCALASAQTMPNDSAQWKQRCDTIVENKLLVQDGRISAAQAAAMTKGISAERFEVLAHDRSENNQHYVACLLFGAAAVAGRANNNAQQVRQDLYLAHVEQKLGNGEKLSFGEKMARASDRMTAASKHSAPPTPEEIAAISGTPSRAAAASTDAAAPASQAAVPAAVSSQPSTTYTPLPNDSPSPSGAERYQWVLRHPARSGTPAVCAVDWTGSGPLSQKCADALFAQAESERASGDCAAAMTDYDNARQAAQNAGTIVMMGLKEGDGRGACLAKLHPPKPDENFAYGSAGVMPVGRYTCYTAPAVIANGGAYGNTIIKIGQWEGYVWIFDDHRYAAPYNEKDAGTYRMNGSTMVAIDGPYGPKRNKTQVTYLPKGVYGRPTLHVAFLGDNGQPTVGVACTHDGPPAKN